MTTGTNLKESVVITVVIVIPLLYTVSAGGPTEFPITTNPHIQHFPKIYGDIVVWEDYRHKNADIYGYNLVTKEEFQITKDAHDQWYPAIYKDIVVWEDERHDKDVIYGFNLSSDQEFHVPQRKQLFFSAHSQHDPAIYSDIVIWTEGLDNTICGYNLSTAEEFVIATTRSDNCPGYVRYVGSERPAIYEDLVVWVDCRNGNYDIYGYNLTSREEFIITESEGRQQSPALYGDIVVWEDKRNGNWDIYGCSLQPPLATVLFNYQERRLLFTIFYGILMVVPVAVAGLLVKHYTKTVTNLDSAPKAKLFPEIHPRNFMKKSGGSSFTLAAFLYGGFSICTIVCLLNRIYFGPIFWCFAVATFISGWWDKSIPYIHTTTDEIVIFPGAARRPEIAKWDTIERANLQKGKNTIRMYFHDKAVDIDLSLMEEKDTEELLQILKQLHCPVTVSFIPGSNS